MTNTPNLPFLELLVRNFIKVEANQDGTKVSYASNYIMDLVNKFLDILKRNKKTIESTV